MPNRYQKVKKRQTYETRGRKTIRKEILSTQIIPQVSISGDELFIIAKFGDRLDTLAYLYYNDASLWWYIAKANNIGKGTWAVKPGTILRIPPRIETEFELLNELQNYNEKYR